MAIAGSVWQTVGVARWWRRALARKGPVLLVLLLSWRSGRPGCAHVEGPPDPGVTPGGEGPIATTDLVPAPRGRDAVLGCVARRDTPERGGRTDRYEREK
ncbi:hypothetical protein Cma02nite_32800 [Cellulomonas marina]|nr:hypothetical protein Cma02nite_32800 [Cellulomonas marina]